MSLSVTFCYSHSLSVIPAQAAIHLLYFFIILFPMFKVINYSVPSFWYCEERSDAATHICHCELFRCLSSEERVIYSGIAQSSISSSFFSKYPTKVCTNFFLYIFYLLLSLQAPLWVHGNLISLYILYIPSFSSTKTINKLYFL